MNNSYDKIINILLEAKKRLISEVSPEGAGKVVGQFQRAKIVGLKKTIKKTPRITKSGKLEIITKKTPKKTQKEIDDQAERIGRKFKEPANLEKESGYERYEKARKTVGKGEDEPLKIAAAIDTGKIVAPRSRAVLPLSPRSPKRLPLSRGQHLDSLFGPRRYGKREEDETK